MILDTIGKVQIQSPTQKELGTYGCLVVNDFGFDMETSLLLRAGRTCSIHRTEDVFFSYINTYPQPHLI